jgi:RNA-directed DNA polymerase
VRLINPTLRGWFQYFQHSQWNTLSGLDSWVRMRLRSILRKNEGRKGRSRGSDQRRWTNAYFDELGLYTLVKARTQIRALSF